MESKLQELATHFVDSLRSLVKAAVNEALSAAPTPEPDIIIPTIRMELDHREFPEVEPGEYTQEKHAKLFGQNKAVREDGDKKVINRDGDTILVHGYQKGKHATPNVGMNQFRDVPTCQEIYIGFRLRPVGVGKGGTKKASRTGKLFGFAVGDAVTSATGGKSITGKGASVRLYTDEEIRIALGIYDHGMPGKYGHDNGQGKFTQLIADQENDIVMRGVINTGNEANGIVQVWHNRKLVCTATNIGYRVDGVKPTGFESVLLQTFTGGSEDNPLFAAPDSVEIEQLGMQIGLGEGDRTIFRPTDRVKVFGQLLGGK